jgi:hypothetical protein
MAKNVKGIREQRLGLSRGWAFQNDPLPLGDNNQKGIQAEVGVPAERVVPSAEQQGLMGLRIQGGKEILRRRARTVHFGDERFGKGPGEPKREPGIVRRGVHH